MYELGALKYRVVIVFFDLARRDPVSDILSAAEHPVSRRTESGPCQEASVACAARPVLAWRWPATLVGPPGGQREEAIVARAARHVLAW